MMTQPPDCGTFRNIRASLFGSCHLLDALRWPVVTACWLVATTAPWRPPIIKDQIDPSWTAVLHDSFGTGRQYGLDLIFTYGPFGFLIAEQYHPHTYMFVLTAMILTAMVCSCVVAWTCLAYIPQRWMCLAWILALPLMSSKKELPFDIATLYLAVRWLRTDRRTSASELLLAPLLGILCLTKFTGTLLIGVFLAFSAIEDLCRWRRLPYASGLALATCLVGWVLAGQELDGLPRFLAASWEVSRGYTDSMAMPGHHLDALCILGSMGLIGITMLLTGLHRHGVWAAIPFAMYSAMTLLISKAACVRSEADHIQIGVRAASLCLMVFLPIVWHDTRSWRLRALPIAAIPLLLITNQLRAVTPLTAVTNFKAGLRAVHSLPMFQSSGTALLDSHRQAQAEIRAKYNFNDVHGSVDIYNFTNTVPLAHGWTYRPRPIFQSYSAYTPRLLRQNAEHLVAGNSPDTIFFSLVDIDNRLLAQMDSLSWPELLSRYAPTEFRPIDHGFLRLAKRASPRRLQWHRATAIRGRIGEPVEIPDHAARLLWAQVDLRPTLLHRVTTLLYKPGTVEVRVNDGQRHKLIPEIARAGMLLSPVVTKSEDFHRLFDRVEDAPQAERVVLYASASEYEAEFVMNLIPLQLSDEP